MSNFSTEAMRANKLVPCIPLGADVGSGGGRTVCCGDCRGGAPQCMSGRMPHTEQGPGRRPTGRQTGRPRSGREAGHQLPLQVSEKPRDRSRAIWPKLNNLPHACSFGDLSVQCVLGIGSARYRSMDVAGYKLACSDAHLYQSSLSIRAFQYECLCLVSLSIHVEHKFAKQTHLKMSAAICLS